jgi:uncharacterized protein YPO0396
MPRKKKEAPPVDLPPLCPAEEAAVEREVFDEVTQSMQKAAKPGEEHLNRLFKAVVSRLTAKIEKGTAKPADINAAIKLLSDNGMQMDIGESDELKELAEGLPEDLKLIHLHGRR